MSDINSLMALNLELQADLERAQIENEQLRNQASHESAGSFQHSSSQSEFAEYSGTNLREAFTRNAEQFDSLMVAMLAENEQLSIHYESEKRRADDRADENLQLRRQIKAMRETESGEMAQLKASSKVCTGCGHDNTPAEKPALACCPDSRYRTATELLKELNNLKKEKANEPWINGG
jgi:hypothetical protein